MKFTRTDVWGFEHALHGMRNPKNSWSKSDSGWGDIEDLEDYKNYDYYNIGKNDLKLAQTLIKAGSEHRKFLRQIFVSVDITAPQFWWSEMDTYKVGTVANSTSKMHKLASTPITLDCFETGDMNLIDYVEDAQRPDLKYPIDHCFVQMCLIPYLEYLRQKYLETKDMTVWKELIRWLPESWLQTRTVTMSYENLLTICKQRSGHKLNEWHWFIDWVHTLPHAGELIFDCLEDKDNG